MIAGLRGVLFEKTATEAIVEVQGVFYRVALSALASQKLPMVGEAITLRVRTVVREDAFDLYGFLTAAEEELFLMLTSVSQVGPKMALTVMSGVEASDLVSALVRGEVGRLTKIHGVGKKTAERLVLELKDKAKVLAHTSNATESGVRKSGLSHTTDLVSALVNLGYKPAQAEAAAEAAIERAGATAAFETQVKEALKVLRS